MTLPDDCVVRLIDLPLDVGGFITESPDGCRNIYINARYSDDGQREALRHELRHADADDLHSTEPLSIIEARAEHRTDRPARGVFTAGVLSSLIRAADLLPPPAPPPAEKPKPKPLTPSQAWTLLACLSELDRWLFAPDYDY